MNEPCTRIEYQEAPNERIFSVEVPVERKKFAYVRLVLITDATNNHDIEVLKVKLDELIKRKINETINMFGEFSKIEKAYCAWILEI